MTQARRQIIDLSETSFYHCVSRCVRRAFLYGEDRYTHKSFNHRKQWLVDRFKDLSSIFSINIAAYAVMSNHYHLVLHVDTTKAATWSDKEVSSRWSQLYHTTALVDRWLNNESLTNAELDAVSERLALWRERLMDISWFMRCLNEYIARKANKEDNCKGRFWEGRFKSQALMDEPALLACMMYVDLNPIRAGMNGDLSSSEFTSIAERITCYKQGLKQTDKPKQSDIPAQPSCLMSFFANTAETNPVGSISYALYDYFELCDWTGRAIRKDKKGAISTTQAKLLTELGLTPDDWLKTFNRFTHHYGSIIGHWQTLSDYKDRFNQHWVKGSTAAHDLYKPLH